MSYKFLGTLLFLILYFWSSKIINTDNGNDHDLVKYDDSDLLKHHEKNNELSWIFDSSVCLLGRIVFFLWTIVMLVNLVYTLNKYVLLFLAVLTIVITAILNMPLFIRSIPAFVILLTIIYFN